MRIFLGQRAWLLQRLTALLILLFVVLGAAGLLAGATPSYVQWHAFASSSLGAVLIVLLFGALCLHAWIGIRDIVLDYVHAPGVRLPLLALIGIILCAVLLRVALTMAAHFLPGA